MEKDKKPREAREEAGKEGGPGCPEPQGCANTPPRGRDWNTHFAKGGPELPAVSKAVHFSAKFLRVPGCSWDETIKLSDTPKKENSLSISSVALIRKMLLTFQKLTILFSWS